MKIFTGDWKTDNKIMYSYLDEVDFYKHGRKGDIMEGIPRSGRSMCWGSSWRYPCRKNTKIEGIELYYTKCREANKHLKDVYKEFINLYWKDFDFNDNTQVQMNKNFPCPPHKDSLNVGLSILVGFGDYLGGEINIVNEDEETIKLDIRKKNGVVFNGANLLHFVSPFTLENTNRYSLVFFNTIQLKNNDEFKSYEII